MPAGHDTSETCENAPTVFAGGRQYSRHSVPGAFDDVVAIDFQPNPREPSEGSVSDRIRPHSGKVSPSNKRGVSRD